jgi:hypothetical protein
LQMPILPPFSNLTGQVKRIDEISFIIGRLNSVSNIYRQLGCIAQVRANIHIGNFNTRFPPAQSFFHMVGYQAPGRGTIRCENKVVDSTAEIRSHTPLSFSRAQDNADRFFYVSFVRRQAEPTTTINAERKTPTTA